MTKKKDYEVGHSKPPKETQFKKGQSGNPKGRPRAPKIDELDIVEILDMPVQARIGKKQQYISAFEASVRKQASRALKDNNLDAALQVLDLCETYGLLKPSKPMETGGVIFAPKGLSPQEWLESLPENQHLNSTQNDEL